MELQTYWLETYGCQMNKAESDALALTLQQNNIYPALSPGQADVVILNTCSVRKTAEDRIWGRIGYYRSEKSRRSFTFIIMGCMGQRLKKDLQQKYPEIDIVAGSFAKPDILSAIRRVRENGRSMCLTEDGDYRFAETHTLGGFKSFIPIMHGCNNFCSYCIVPYVRGREVSREPQAVIKEITNLDNQGIKEITLLGQNVNSYKYTGNGSTVLFSDILRTVVNNIYNIQWVRFLTSHPKDFSPGIITLLQNHSRLCRHIHLPVQHGSNTVLTRMKRRYTRELYLKLIESIKNAVSDVSITTDILIGFPGETAEDFRMTCELMKTAQFNDAFTYYYNPREGTEAYGFEDSVPHEIKIERLQKIIALQSDISRKRKLAKLGQKVPVLVEGISKNNTDELLARTEHDDMVVFPGDGALIGTFCSVKLSEVHGNTFYAKLCS